MKKSRIKLLLENLVIYGGITALNKLIPFLLLPVITRALVDTAEYGKYEVYNTMVGLGTTLSAICCSTALFKSYFDSKEFESQQQAVTSANILAIIGGSVISGLCILFQRQLSIFFFDSPDYTIIVKMVAIHIICSASLSMWQNTNRLKNNRKIYASVTLVQSLLYYLLALLFIQKGLKVWGLIVAEFVAVCIALIAYIFVSKELFSWKALSSEKIKTLLKISIPLLPGGAIYWIFGSMDKVMITHMLSVGDTGVYSVGTKMASIAQLVYTAFVAGWQYFSFSTMNDDDQVEMNSKIFEYLSAIVLASILIAMPFYKLVFNLMYDGDYISAYIVFPFLFLSPLILMLYQALVNQFVFVNKAYLSIIILAIGAVTNIVLNYILISLMGIRGAAIATFCGYLVSLIIEVIYQYKHKLVVIRNKTVLIFVAMMIALLFCYIDNTLLSIVVASLELALILLLYKSEIRMLIGKIRRGKAQ